jgi:small subunit ribosomal protein S17
MTTTRGRRRVQRGRVKSAKQDKTIAVTVSWKKQHPLYGKYIQQKTTLYAHDESNEAAEGDLVELAETRPMSKTKRWRLVKVLHKAAIADSEKTEAEKEGAALEAAHREKQKPVPAPAADDAPAAGSGGGDA